MKQLEVGQESQLVLVDIDDPGRIIFQFPVMEDMQALQDNDARMKEVSAFLIIRRPFYG
uniref:Uncharacterized protein n=1 Tax=Magallana gigas TaxID=29159 RepID=K1Q2S6_MAGGI